MEKSIGNWETRVSQKLQVNNYWFPPEDISKVLAGHLVPMSWPVIWGHRLQPLVSFSQNVRAAAKIQRQVTLRGDAMAGGLLANRKHSYGRAEEGKTRHFFHHFIVRGSAKRGYLEQKNNLTSLLDLDTKMSKNGPKRKILILSFKGRFANWRVWLSQSKHGLESSGVELQRTEKGAEDIWEDKQRPGQGRRWSFSSSSCHHTPSLLKIHTTSATHTGPAEAQG